MIKLILFIKVIATNKIISGFLSLCVLVAKASHETTNSLNEAKVIMNLGHHTDKPD